MALGGLLNPPRLKRLLPLLLLIVVIFIIRTQTSSYEGTKTRWSRFKDGMPNVDFSHMRHSDFLSDVSKLAVDTGHLDFLIERHNQVLTEDALGGDSYPEDEFSEEEVSEAAGQDPNKYNHQTAIEIPKSPLYQRQCDAIPAWYLHELAGKAAPTTTNDPLIYHFRSGHQYTEQNAEAIAGSEFCSVVLVPQHAPADTFRNQAIEGWGPDSLHIEFASADVRLIPEHPRFWDMSEVKSPELTFAVYMLAYALNQPGTYEVSGEVEFKNYDWVMEDQVDFLQGQQHPHDMLQVKLHMRSPSPVITGAPLARPAEQCYRGGLNDLHGRWYRASAWGASGQQIAGNPAAVVPFADGNTTVDEWGWTFAPDACSLNLFSSNDISQCLADRSLEILGESNSRRLLKSLMSAGHWCKDTTDKQCECEDQFEDEIPDYTLKSINTTRLHDTDNRDSPTTFGTNSKVFFDFIGGIINRKLWNPWGYFYAPASKQDKSTVISRRVNGYGPVDLVHVSPLTWDIAGVRTADEVRASLPDFKAKILAAYPPGTRFITRLANNMCCGNQDHRTRFSAPRFAIFNEMYRRFWAEDERKGAMLVDDASVLQGRRDAETAFFCPTTHLRASHVRLEAQMWLNAVCDGGTPGTTPPQEQSTAKMRDWGYGAVEIYAAQMEAHEAKKAL